jgi:hypothetical protein
VTAPQLSGSLAIEYALAGSLTCALRIEAAVPQVIRDEALPAVSFVQPSAYTARISSVLPRAFIAPAIPSILEV